MYLFVPVTPGNTHTMTDDRTLLSRRSTLGIAGATLGGLALGGLGVAAQENGGNGEENGNGNGNGNGDDGGENASRRYRVTVANLTDGQSFTPPAVAAHRPSVEVFSVGEPANEAVQQIAENGNLAPLLELVESSSDIRGAVVGPRNDEGDPVPLVPQADPGETGLPWFATLHLDADASAGYLSFISMLIATNDGFTGLDTVPLPTAVNESRTYYANAYDAGTEMNTERFADLVPPAQALSGIDWEGEGTGMSNPDLAEDGVITPHPGIQGVGDLDPALFDWDEPVALVQVERLA
jgi:hypothetical protein